jgi:hypothetical protein
MVKMFLIIWRVRSVMKRFIGVLLFLSQSLAANAEQPDSYVSPFEQYQAWHEPTVQNWPQNQAQLINEPSMSHSHHEGMNMSEDEPMDMQHMNHEQMDMPQDDTVEADE